MNETNAPDKACRDDVFLFAWPLIACGRHSARKVVGLRLWDNPESGKKWDCSVVQMKYEILLGL